MRNFIVQLRSVIAFAKREYVIWTSYKVNIVTWILDVFINSALFFMLSLLMGKHANIAPYGNNYVSFVVLGLSAYYISYTNLGDPYDRVARIYWNGTMDLYLLSPLSLVTPVIGIMYRSVLDDYPRVLLAFLFGTLFFGAAFRFMQPFTILLIVILLGISTFGIGMISASSFFLLNLKVGTEPVKFIFQDIIIALAAGYFYPISVLPYSLQLVSSVLPHTYALDALRRLMIPGGNPNIPVLPIQKIWHVSPIFSDLVILLAMSVVFLFLGFYLYALGIERARRNGTLTRWQ
ncbi:MAG: ABC transporter permease [Caldisericaceae bacterium]|jgi:ABC-2 type transport system permease protein|nr:ABC transporter permease [Caldisericaceae bacterium]